MAALERLEAWEPHLNAFTTVFSGQALRSARRLQSQPSRTRGGGALWGIPVAVKDNLHMRGVRTTAGSDAPVSPVPRRHATAVARLFAAEAILLGKTNLPELAYGPVDTYRYGPTRNPWRLSRFAGGSSMGSGAAVAAGIVPAALGSDTTGSIRNPASWSGVTGLKPTYALVSVYGMVPLAPSLDHVGPLGRSALDCAILLDVIAGYDPMDPGSDPRAREGFGYARVTGLPPSPTRVGVLRSLFAPLAHDVASVLEQSLDTFASLGVRLVDVEIPGWNQAVHDALLIAKVEASVSHADLLSSYAGRLQPQVRERLRDGLAVPVTDYVHARARARVFRRRLGDAFEAVDVLALPGRERTAPPMDADGGRPPGETGARYTAPFNLTGFPSLVLPVGLDREMLPVGLQIAAPPWRDATLLCLANAYQQVTDWHTRRPPAPDASSATTQAQSLTKDLRGEERPIQLFDKE